jgi:endogenous inhibitor of DNA gyrase (YacG/DUF329 family)
MPGTGGRGASLSLYPTVSCPKCGRQLPADGEVSFGGSTLPVYSCPECVTRTTFMGERMELPLTFLIGPDGKAYDPANPGGEIDLTEYD